MPPFLVKVKRDKYFRLLAEVEVDGQPLHSMLIAKNLAVAYEGGVKPKVNWCDKMKHPVMLNGE